MFSSKEEYCLGEALVLTYLFEASCYLESQLEPLDALLEEKKVKFCIPQL